MEVTLTVNGETKFTETVGADGAVTYEAFRFNAATDAEDGVVTIAESGGYELWIDGVQVDGVFTAATGQKLPDSFAGKTFYDASVVADNALVIETAPTAISVTTAVTDGKVTNTIDLSSLTAADGKLELISKEAFEANYAEVTFAADAEIASFDALLVASEENDTAVTTTDAADIFYVKKGATIFVTTSEIDGSATAPTVDTDYMTAQVGEKTETIKADKWNTETNTACTAEFEYTVTADVTIDMVIEAAGA